MKKVFLFSVVLLAWQITLAAASLKKKIPIVVDTDIGSDIDDAFALALILRSPELDLLGVTTVSGDAQARARLAAKLLWEGGRRTVPVVAGEPGKPLPSEQTRWAQKFSSSQIRREKATTFLDSLFRRRPRQITLVCIGPLTNIAALFDQDPGVAKKIKQIVMMGGSIAHGYGQDLTPTTEYNIAADPQAAKKVFTSGVPILMAPLDVTAMLRLRRTDRERIFTELTPLTNALTILYHLWGRKTPILFDPMAVTMLINPNMCRTQPLDINVDANGFTEVVKGQPPNATVATYTHPEDFFEFYLKRVAP